MYITRTKWPNVPNDAALGVAASDPPSDLAHNHIRKTVWVERLERPSHNLLLAVICLEGAVFQWFNCIAFSWYFLIQLSNSFWQFVRNDKKQTTYGQVFQLWHISQSTATLVACHPANSHISVVNLPTASPRIYTWNLLTQTLGHFLGGTCFLTKES